MGKRRNKKVEAPVENTEAKEPVTNEEGKETEEVTEKKKFFEVIKEGAGKVVKSTPFKVAVGAAIGVAATIGGKILLDNCDGEDYYEDTDKYDDFDDSDDADDTDSSEPEAADEN